MLLFPIRPLSRALLSVVITMLGMHLATAGPVTWTLVGFTFNDGGTASGSFTYNRDTDVATLIDITTSGGTITGATYLALAPPPNLDDFGIDMVPNGSLANFTGSPLLILNLTAAMTDAGGVIPIAPATSEGTCSNTGCSSFTPMRDFSTGEIVSSAVPEPSTLLALPAGAIILMAAAWRRRERKLRSEGPKGTA